MIERTRNWLITGVGSGLGRALAEAALARGDSVIGTLRTKEAAEAFSGFVPGRSFARLLNLTDEAGIRQIAVEAEEMTGGIDVLVNNAGYGLVGAVEEATLAEIRAQFDINVFGPVALMQAFLPYMRARRAGLIVNVTSVSGLVGWPSLGLYSGSKFALEGISETLALEVAPLGIKVIIIEPGGMRTEFSGRNRACTARRIDDYDATVGESRRILADHAGCELGDPIRAAAAVLAVTLAEFPPLRLLLGSDALRYTTEKLAVQSAEIAAWSLASQSTDIVEQ